MRPFSGIRVHPQHPYYSYSLYFRRTEIIGSSSLGSELCDTFLGGGATYSHGIGGPIFLLTAKICIFALYLWEEDCVQMRDLLHFSISKALVITSLH